MAAAGGTAQPSSKSRMIRSSIDDLCPMTAESDCGNMENTQQFLSTSEFPCGQKSSSRPINQDNSQLCRNNESTESLLQLLQTSTENQASESFMHRHRSRPTLPPKNPTLESMGKKTVVLIRINSEAYENVLTNPLTINKLISKSNFKKLDIKDIRVNKNKKIIAIENKNVLQDSQIDELTKITHLDDVPVACYIPNSDRYVYGVIGPISTETDLEELKHEINMNNDIQVIQLARLRRRVNNTWTDTQSIKITLSTDKLPESIKINYINFRVRAFVQSPMQCFKCQRLGHTAKSCTSQFSRCMLCGERHDKRECGNPNRFCINCKGNHAANSNQCPYITQAKEIEKMKVNGIDYRTAREQLRQQEYPHSSLPSSNTNINTYANVVRNNKNIVKDQDYNNNNNARDTSTQTDKYNIHDHKNEKTFLEKLRNFILEILDINMENETKSARLLLADGAVRNNFGVDLREEQDTIHGRDNEDNMTIRKRILVNTSCEEDVLSQQESEASDGRENIWETVEKKVVKKPIKKASNRQSKRKKQKQ